MFERAGEVLFGQHGRLTPVQGVPDYRLPEQRVAKPRILIANRGEIAVRIIRTCPRARHPPSSPSTRDADRDALHVQMADQAYRIGPPLPADSYLSIGAILDAAQKARATRSTPATGSCPSARISPRRSRRPASRSSGRPREAIEHDGRQGGGAAGGRPGRRADRPRARPSPSPSTTRPREAERIGFPVIVKAAFGGGGEGMHVVRKAEELPNALSRAAREAQSYFGRPEVFLERYVDRAHHVEAQVFADAHGNVFFLGERDCSVQRRHQKLIEETPSPVIDEDLRERIGEAVDGARARRPAT